MKYRIDFWGSFLSRVYAVPEYSLLVSFLSLIVLGTLLLKTSWAADPSLSWIDALFTATSATCVTGLVVVDTGTRLTPIGQSIVLLLIQFGGLGIMTFSASVLLNTRKMISSRQTVAMSHILDQEDVRELGRMLRFILWTTMILELIGTIFLSVRWFLRGVPVYKAICWGVFHSVSAFCNAGFSLFSDSFAMWRSDLWILSAVMILVILGGIGYVVLEDIFSVFVLKERKYLWLHTKLMILFTLLLLSLGAVGLIVSDTSGVFTHLPISERVVSALFHSVNARTAGFNCLPVEKFSSAGKFLLMILMFIGAGSGSTGGGIKVSTFAVLVLSAWQYVRNQGRVVIFHREISPFILFKAVAIFMFSLFLIFCAGMSLMMLGGFDGNEWDLMFEVVSAFGTVGLSCGITSKLSFSAKIVIIALMYVGRVGPLAVAMILMRKRGLRKIEFPMGKVMVG